MAGAGFWVGFCSYDLGRAIEHIDAKIHENTLLRSRRFRNCCAPASATKSISRAG
jgi:hypothetical protein